MGLLEARIIPTKLVRLVKMCLNETCSIVRLVKFYPMHFLVIWYKGIIYRYCFSTSI